MSTPSMRLGDLIRRYRNRSDSKIISEHLNEAFALGHEFGLARAVDEIDTCDSAVDATYRIRALKVERVQSVTTRDEDFL